MGEHAYIQDFIRRAMSRFNRSYLLGGLCIGFAVAAIGAVCVAGGFVLGGYKVHMPWLTLPLAVGTAVWLVWYIVCRCNFHQAAKRADDHFEMKDGLVSAVEFKRQGRDDGFSHLQAKHTAGVVKQADLKEIRFRPPTMLIVAAMLLFVTTAWLSTFANSPAVQARLDDQADTLLKTDEIKKALNEQLDELEKDLTKEEKEKLDKAGLRKMIRKLKAEKDRKKAMRQYAKIERKLRKFSEKQMRRNDAKFLAKLAKELLKGKATRKLGNELANKNYMKAAKTMQEMKPGKSMSRDELKRLAKAMSEMARRMDQACQQSQNSNGQQSSQNQSGQKNGKNQNGKNQSGKNQSGKNSSRNGNSSRMQQLSQEFSQAASEFSKSTCKGSKSSMSEMQSKCDKAGKAMSQMAREMMRMQASQNFAKKMGKMRSGLGRCQSYCAAKGKGQGKGQGQGKGFGNGEGKGKGKGFGMGLSQSPENGRGIGSANHGGKRDAELTDDKRGKYDRIKGQKGSGPSEMEVSDANSGTGTASRTGRGKMVKFKTETESLIRREDVPEEIKSSVKEYFEIIHEDVKPSN